MNITTDIDSKFRDETTELAIVIDSSAFESDKYFDDDKLPIAYYYADRRAKANLLAGKILKAGYRKIG